MLARVNRNYVPAYWDDFFNDSFFNNNYKTVNCNNTSPRVNVEEEDELFRIEVAVPGLNRDDIHIDLEDDVITISSGQEESKEEEKRNFLRREFRTMSFKRSFQLPETIDQENIRASHESGILTVELPKKAEVVEKAPRKIEIA